MRMDTWKLRPNRPWISVCGGTSALAAPPPASNKHRGAESHSRFVEGAPAQQHR